MGARMLAGLGEFFATDGAIVRVGFAKMIGPGVLPSVAVGVESGVGVFVAIERGGRVAAPGKGTAELAEVGIGNWEIIVGRRVASFVGVGVVNSEEGGVGDVEEAGVRP